MAVNKVSFGSVVAISGKPQKINRLNRKMRPYINTGYVIVQDVTPEYKYAASTGVMAQAAQRGDSISIYITDSDVENVKQKRRNWDTTCGILSNLKAHYNINGASISQAISKIINS